ncbi:AEC family transporter [Rhodoblastus sp. 17X3]|uniref:AEC family transporter n=1 Tax=Rhodoblastus sp. 17X3 TaxID=3047026 RepID=UPI0024B6D5FE|nr:AEC family transporter [Rhodoblastus sp. 17X3]MDI9848712.1 AEC family transporter [Rhodoblastus sp. 17X3]
MTVAALNALAPVVLLIGLGHFLKRCRALDEAFWPQAERICYFVLLPALFFHGTATAEIGELPAGRLSVALIASTLVLSALIVAARPLIRTDGAGFTSVFQGGIRFNNYIGLMLVSGMLGVRGVAYAAICNAALVPTVNVLSVLVFARYGEVRLSPLQVLWQSVTNPLVLACLGGLAFHMLGFALPFGVEPAMKALGGAALPLGLLCVGAALRFSGVRGWASPIFASSLFKLAAAPALTFLAARLFGLPSTPATVALLYQSLPTASSAYIQARQLGGDAPLMAGITAAQTIMAAATLPLALGLLAPG